MPHQDSLAELQKSLDVIIGEMKSIQRQIASGTQPASMHELDALIKLGQQYVDIVKRLQKTL
jgi:hypothetical protein